MSKDVYILAGGGTGGHLYPGLAVAEELLRLDGEARVVFACSNRPIDRRILEPTAYAMVPQPIRPAPGLRSAWGFLRSYVASAFQSRQMVCDLRPAAVLGLGGFAAVPLVRAAWKAGIPTGLLNPDAVPGKANRFLARRARAVFVQFASTADCFGAGLRERIRHVGCPVRCGFLTARRDDALRALGLAADRRTLLVNGGSLGAQSINQAFEALAAELDELADTWQVLHVTGHEKGGRGQAAAPGSIEVRALEYCHRMELAYAAADLALCRAGASTIAELSATGTPAVIMPYPFHADQHQRLNAQALAGAGAAEIVDDRADQAANAAALRQSLLPLMRDADRLEAMSQAARNLANPHAARQVAQWMHAAD
ncbi:MAG TPA: UDP-N-acetylglucosamine--N-acetylmuramyl-(pentapeptide) pyrophosphoryl-undecaprenol N-acetylglucosamine transferase [Phycisphaerae bacterium]|nr:UDP-N-acetylglucosamine--N-acetylmuramyl-(pentapeptide) pyrophosphoryl-undecaprenol N-acetylglucosamine transferase [Phycisphaerae bacterium]